MGEALTTEANALVKGADGVMRVRGTRVTLDSLVAAFSEGATAEEIAQQYPSVSLADVYQIIGYYLRHETELEEYFSGRRMESVSVCSPGARGNFALAGGRELQQRHRSRIAPQRSENRYRPRSG